MAKSDYRPGRRRKPTRAWLLDWAAGVLVGILVFMLGSGVVSLVVPEGAARLVPLLILGAVGWPVGAALGVWLCMGRAGGGLALGLGAGAATLGGGLLLLPRLLELEAAGLTRLCVPVALVVAPALARVVIAKLRAREA